MVHLVIWNRTDFKKSEGVEKELVVAFLSSKNTEFNLPNLLNIVESTASWPAEAGRRWKWNGNDWNLSRAFIHLEISSLERIPPVEFAQLSKKFWNS